MVVAKVPGLEIFTNPDDLEISVGIPEGSNKFAVLVTRGEGHSYKPLVSCPATYDSREAAVEMVCDSLRDICRQATKILTDPDDDIARVVNRDNLPADDLAGLNEERIDWIVQTLLAGRVANTSPNAGALRSNNSDEKVTR